MGEQLPAKSEQTEPAETDSEQPEVTRVIVRTRAAAPWAVAAVFITAILVAGFLVYTVTYRLPHEAATVAVETIGTTVDRISDVPKGIAAAFRPNVNVNTTIRRAIDTLQTEAKLVVLTASVDVEVAKTSQKRVLWDLLQLGDTTVRLRVHENKVQYYIPVVELSSDNFQYDPERGVVCLQLPEPVLDRVLVDVQSDPGRVEVESEVGWGRLQYFSGNYLEDEARRQLRDAVLQEGASEVVAERARREGEKVVTALLSNLVSGFREGVTFQVQFEPPDKSQGSTVNG